MFLSLIHESESTKTSSKQCWAQEAWSVMTMLVTLISSLSLVVLGKLLTEGYKLVCPLLQGLNTFQQWTIPLLFDTFTPIIRLCSYLTKIVVFCF